MVFFWGGERFVARQGCAGPIIGGSARNGEVCCGLRWFPLGSFVLSLKRGAGKKNV